MTRTLAAGAILTTLMFCVQPAAAAEAPWCAVLQNSTESVYWDCQYGSIEQCRADCAGRQSRLVQSEPLLRTVRSGGK